MKEGFDETNPITNLALPIVSIAVAFFVLLLSKMMHLCCSKVARSTRLCNIKCITKLNSKTQKLYISVKESLCWNYPLRLLTEEYMTISLACMIKVNALDYSNFYEALTSTFAILLLTLTIVSPFIITKWMWTIQAKCLDCLEDETFSKRWGAWKLDIRAEDKYALMFTLVFMLRRSALAMIIIGLPRLTWLQI